MVGQPQVTHTTPSPLGKEYLATPPGAKRGRLVRCSWGGRRVTNQAHRGCRVTRRLRAAYYHLSPSPFLRIHRRPSHSSPTHTQRHQRTPPPRALGRVRRQTHSQSGQPGHVAEGPFTLRNLKSFFIDSTYRAAAAVIDAGARTSEVGSLGQRPSTDHASIRARNAGSQSTNEHTPLHAAVRIWRWAGRVHTALRLGEPLEEQIYRQTFYNMIHTLNHKVTCGNTN